MLKPTVDGAFEDMKRLIKSGEYVPHGAAIADNDTVAIGAIKAIREAGIRFPRTFLSSALTIFPSAR